MPTQPSPATLQTLQSAVSPVARASNPGSGPCPARAARRDFPVCDVTVRAPAAASRCGDQCDDERHRWCACDGPSRSKSAAHRCGHTTTAGAAAACGGFGANPTLAAAWSHAVRPHAGGTNSAAGAATPHAVVDSAGAEPSKLLPVTANGRSPRRHTRRAAACEQPAVHPSRHRRRGSRRSGHRVLRHAANGTRDGERCRSQRRQRQPRRGLPRWQKTVRHRTLHGRRRELGTEAHRQGSRDGLRCFGTKRQCRIWQRSDGRVLARRHRRRLGIRRWKRTSRCWHAVGCSFRSSMESTKERFRKI